MSDYMDQSVYADVEQEAKAHWRAERPDEDRPGDDDEHETFTLPKCGEGACYHQENGLPCPPDPWADTP